MFDVLIVGAGMVGASLACALGDKNCAANRNLKVGIIEASDNFLRENLPLMVGLVRSLTDRVKFGKILACGVECRAEA